MMMMMMTDLYAAFR